MQQTDKQELQRIKQLVSKIQQINDDISSGNSSGTLVEQYLQQIMEQDISEFSDDLEQLKNQFSDAFIHQFDILTSLNQITSKLESLVQKSQQQQPPSQQSSNNNKRGANNQIDFQMMKDVNAKVTRIQAWFRKELTLKKLQNDIQKQKQALNQRKGQESPEEGVLREFSQQLTNKKITPEAFFRICDTDYKQSVRVDVFKDFMTRMGIQLSRGQISRLIMVLDEDMEGSITREEFYNALEAYNVAGEKHKFVDGNGGLYYQFEHRVMFKLIGELQKKDITYIQMFNSCDVNDDARVDIKEVRKFVEGLCPDFKVKELHSLMNYLDIDRNGLIDKDEFTRQMNKAEQQYKQSLLLSKSTQRNQNSTSKLRNIVDNDDDDEDFQREKVKENNFFEEENVQGGDQAFFGLFGSSSKKTEPVKEVPKPNNIKPNNNNNNYQSSNNYNNNYTNNNSNSKQSGKQMPPVQQQQQTFEDKSTKKKIVQKMEEEGQNLKSFFGSIKDSIKDTAAKGQIAVGGLFKKMDSSHPTITTKEKYDLVKDCIVDNNKVDLVKLEQTLQKNGAKNIQTSVNSTFSVIANNIVKKMGGSPSESIRMFFKAQSLTEFDQISEMEFAQMFSGRKFQTTLTPKELEAAFDSLNLDRDGFATAKDLMDVLISYVDNNKSGVSINMKNVGSVIKGYEAMSPRSRIEELIEYIIQELKNKNLKPVNVYKMADTKNAGTVAVSALEQAFCKLLPNISSDVFSEAMNAFKLTGHRDVISRVDFDTVFQESTTSLQNSSLKRPSTSDSAFKSSSRPLTTASPQLSDSETIQFIRKLDNVMLRKGISPTVAFKSADLNYNNVVTVDELKEAIKKLIPEENLPLAELKKIMMAFDQNRNGLIEEQEFIQMFETARNTNVTFIESPVKSRILGSDNQLSQQQQNTNNDRSSKLPMKGNIVQDKQSSNDAEIQQLTDQLQQKINLKQLLGDLQFNEQQEISINSIGRKLKTQQTNTNQTLKPSEYLNILKYIDKESKGLVHGRDLIKFCEKFIKNNQSDYILELKYIANVLEFQKNNRSTQQFFENNTKIKGGVRLMEVELLAELQKQFTVPMSIGKLIYKQLDTSKKGGQLQLEDLCSLIDQYRQVQIPQAQQKTASSKINPESALLKFIIQLICLPQRKKELLDQKLEEIGQQENGLSYRTFYDVYVDELQIVDNAESKSIFEYLKVLSKNKNNVINFNTFYTTINQQTQQIQNAQFQAISSIIQKSGTKYFEALAKLKMNDLGYLSKAGFKDIFVQLSIASKKGDNSQQSPYIQSLRSILHLEQDFIFPQPLQVLELLDQLLLEETENAQFFVILDLQSRLCGQFDICDEILFKFLGKMFDILAPNKPSYAVIQAVCPDCISVNNSDVLHRLILTVQEQAQKKNQQISHGQITDACQTQFELLWKKLGGKAFKIQNDDIALLQKINRHRGKLPNNNNNQSANNNLTENNGQQSNNNSQEKQLVDGIEQQMKSTIEKIMEESKEDVLFMEVIPMTNFQRIFTQINQNIDKKMIQQLCFMIDSRKTAKIYIKDLIEFLKKVPQKYDKEQVLNNIANDVEEPASQFLENQSFSPFQQYSKQDFYDQLSNFTNISKFNSVCLFYDCLGFQDEDSSSQDQMSCDEFIQLIIQQKENLKKPKKSNTITNNNKKIEEKKTVKFVEDEASFEKEAAPITKESKQCAQMFVQVFPKINENTITNGLQKLTQQFQSVKDIRQIMQRFQPDGSQFIQLGFLYKRFDDFTFWASADEKLGVLFVAFDLSQPDRYLVDLSIFAKLIKSTQQPREIFSSLKRVYEVLKQKQQSQQQEPQQKQQVQQQQQNVFKQEKTIKGTQNMVENSASNINPNEIEHDDTEQLKQEMKDVFIGIQKLINNNSSAQKLVKLFETGEGVVSQNQIFRFFKTEGLVAPKQQLDKFADELNEHGTGDVYIEYLLDIFNEFGIQYDKQLFSRVTRAKTALQDAEGIELTVDNLTYKVTAADYYRGIKSILNNESAALVIADQLYKNIPDGKEFIDVDFGPKDDNDKEANKKALYFTGVPPKGYINPDSVIWLRPEEYCDEPPQFVDDGASANDVRQGAIGDCWFIGALSVLATRDELLRGGLPGVEINEDTKITGKIAQAMCEGVYPPIFHMYRKKGLYVMRFYKDFQTRYVIIDEKIPCNKSNGFPVFATCKNLHELWVPLVEKAYAKLHGCYETLISGFIDDGLSDMTGLCSEKLKLHDEKDLFPHKMIKDKETFWTQLKEWCNQGSLMGCSVAGETERNIQIDGRPAGILSGHAYGIIDVFDVEDKNMQNPRKCHRLLRVRNPWGKAEWQGKWSDSSIEIKEKYKAQIDKYLAQLNKLHPDEVFVPGEEDGTFLINYQSWRDIYNNMFVTLDFPPEWSAIRFKSEWNDKTSGGTPSPLTDESKKRWAKNPQFYISPDEDIQIFIQLAQPDGRVQQPDKKYYKYPYVELIHPICFAIVLLPDGQDRVTEFNKNQIIFTSIMRESRDVTGRIDLLGGKRYAIVCCTRNAGEKGIFYLSLYFSAEEREVEIFRIDDPKCKSKIYSLKFIIFIETSIVEESEGSGLVPKWKRQMVKNRLKYMFSNNDVQDDSQVIQAHQQQNTSQKQNNQQIKTQQTNKRN